MLYKVLYQEREAKSGKFGKPNTIYTNIAFSKIEENINKQILVPQGKVCKIISCNTVAGEILT